MTVTKTYVNRYSDKIVFEQNGDSILMSGYSPLYCRFGYPNDYNKAYEAYCDVVYEHPDGIPLSLEKFTEVVHDFREDKNWIMKLFGPLVESDTSTYNMFDPSGGPYIGLGADMSRFGLEGFVKHIEISEDKVLLTVRK